MLCSTIGCYYITCVMKYYYNISAYLKQILVVSDELSMLLLFICIFTYYNLVHITIETNKLCLSIET